MRNIKASQKNIHKVHTQNIQQFLGKAHQWRSKKLKNNLLQIIKEEDIRLNEDLCSHRMVTSHGINKIWERYIKKFLAKSQYRIHRLNKAWFKKWVKKTGYIYTIIQIPLSHYLLDNFYQERRASNKLYYIGKDDKISILKILHCFILSLFVNKEESFVNISPKKKKHHPANWFQSWNWM